ncbi:ComGF family competence protein [Aciduricibacillus chroicocephali]|uniref:ComGF family competence protein n=1 Tax=Aciduricibacillus chroicocephali TaxID=3054939 RepID=A0ABY9KSQ5_9BACI|nr:ComGF family competence protein [Bacillaceae bacterium 44XB]
MAIPPSEHGFTFISLLLGLTFLAIAFPLLAHTLKTAKHDSYYEELSIQQFFSVLRIELAQASNVHIDSDKRKISYKLPDDSETAGVAMIGQYEDLIRRQVDNLGHEIYLRGIQTVQFERLSYGLKVLIVGKGGEDYSKVIVLHEKQ